MQMFEAQEDKYGPHHDFFLSSFAIYGEILFYSHSLQNKVLRICTDLDCHSVELPLLFHAKCSKEKEEAKEEIA